MSTQSGEQKFNPANLLRNHADQYPDKVAISYPVGISNGKVVYQELSYKALEAESDKAAYALRAAGFKPADKSVFMVKVGPALFIQVFALFKVGAIPVIVDPGMGIKRMLHCFHSVGAETFMGIPVATMVRMAAKKVFSSVRSSVTIWKNKIWRQERLLKGVDLSKPFPIHQALGDTPALISFTTGSTGPAKAVECTQRMAHAMMWEMKQQADITEKDVQLLTLPFFGVIGLMQGNTCVLPEMNPIKPAHIVPTYLIQAINDYQTSVMFGSPSLLNALGSYCKDHGIVLEPLRMVNCGGAPMTLDIMKTFRSVLREEAVFETAWGATEGLPLSSIPIDTLLGEMKEKMDAGLGTCIGKAVGQVQVKAIKLTQGSIESWSKDLEVAHGEVGELVVAGDNISPRYHKDTESDRAHKIPDKDGIWHRTGDLGWLDDQNRIWFCGRYSHLVRLANPEKILFSVQSEGVTNGHSDVYRSALVTVFSDDAERKAAAMCIELYPDIGKDQIPRIKKELVDLMKQHSATERVSHVLFHPSFPVDIRHNAKIERHALGVWATEQLIRSR